jgi:hypothetical protein
MSSFAKILGGTVLGAGLIAGVNYFKNIKRAKAELEVIPTANLYSLSWDGVTIRIDVLIKNPTSGSSSQALNKNIKIAAHGEAMIDKILITVPVTSVFSLVFGLIKALHNKEAIKLTIKTMTEVDIGFAKIPYDNETEVVLKKG